MTLLALLTVLGTQFDHGNFNVSDKQSCEIYTQVSKAGNVTEAFKLMKGHTFTHTVDDDDVYEAVENASCN